MGLFNQNTDQPKLNFDKKVGDLWVDTANRKFFLNNAYTEAFGKGKPLLSLKDNNLFNSFLDVKKIPDYAHDFSELNGFEVLEDDTTVTKGGLGMAAVGAIAFGAAGAVVGAIAGGKETKKKSVNHIILRFDLNNFNTPTLYIRVIDKPVKVKSKEYTEAYNTVNNQISVLNLIMNNQSNPS